MEEQPWPELGLGRRAVHATTHAMAPPACADLIRKTQTILWAAQHGGRCPLQAWPVVALTPPPEELISAASVREARSRVQMVADRLALAGAAVVNTFVSVANGDIVVVDVNCVPDFVPGAPLLQQVRHCAPVLL